ncbi:hypothetical protein [Pendulispora albinea]|uniref:Secreted protein n=1 Tax=Pendulispora albinea TaxID=2741071 RepID=A0ABZ2LZG7_9BACT
MVSPHRFSPPAARPIGVGALLVFALAPLGGVGCATPEPEQPEVPYVRISMVGATLGPAKIDGTRWDALTVFPNLAAGVTTSAGGSTHMAIVAAHLTGEVLASFEKPDPFGWAELTAADRAVGERRPLTGCGDDTLTPTWSTAAQWRHVRLSDSTRIRVHLLDRDLDGNEPMGDVDVHAGHLRMALEKGTIVQVPVSDQSQGQVLAIAISVAPDG